MALLLHMAESLKLSALLVAGLEAECLACGWAESLKLSALLVAMSKA